MISPVRAAVAATLTLAMAAGCSASGSGDAVSTSGELAAPAETSVPAAPRSSTSSTTPSASAPVVSATVATVPDVGVPGLDSDDPFCRGWSEFAGTFQALVLASATGDDPIDAARSEVVAAGALLAAVDALESSFPVEVVDEREVFIDGLLGPFATRAEQARDALIEAGLVEPDVRRLGALWLDALATAGVDDPTVTVVVPTGLAPSVDAAVVAFTGTVPAIGDDRSLVTDADPAATMAHIAANCPDQGTLGGNDVVG